MKSKWLKIVLISIFAAALALPLPVSLIIGEKSNEDEKRTPAQYPQYFTNNYFREVNAWYNDHSPFRTDIIKLYNKVDDQIEGAYYDWIIKNFYPVNPSPEPVPEPEPDPEPHEFDYDLDLPYPYLDAGTTPYPVREKGEVIYGRDNWLFFSGETSLDCYRGKNVDTEESLNYFAWLIRNVTDQFKEKGITLTILIPPNKEQIYADKMPTYPIIHRAKRLQRIAYFMNNIQGITNFLYPLEYMINLRKEGKDIYLMQDTHWNSIGAVETARYMDAYFGNPVRDYETSPITVRGGDLAQMAAIDGDEYTAYGVTNYKPEIEITRETEVRKGTEVITTTNIDKPHCLMFRDSFKERFDGVFAKNFSSLTMIHNKVPREGQTDIYVPCLDELQSGDHIVIECIERAFGTAIKILEALYSYNQK